VAVGSHGFDGEPNSTVSWQLAEIWNGRSWSTMPGPTDPEVKGLAEVSCPRISACMAVGGNISELWRGHEWKVIPTPSL
jgi:hypothetical protein